MKHHTHTVCAALVLTLAASVAHAQTAPVEGAAQTTATPKPTEPTSPASPTQQKPAPPRSQPKPATTSSPSASVPTLTVATGVTPPPGYLIGADDVLSIVFWRDKDMTTDVQVRPDGKISLSLLNDVDAAGLTPDQLRERLTEESKKYMEDANITVVVKQINSRKVYITGQVTKQGPYVLNSPTTVMQLIALAGGLAEFADSKNIVVIRTENGRQVAHKVNYKDVIAGKKLAQNIELKPGDTILVP